MTVFNVHHSSPARANHLIPGPRRAFLRFAMGVLVFTVTLAAACSGGSGPADGSQPEETPSAAFPGATWEKATPEELGLDAGKLEEIAAEAEAAGSNCLVVVRDGKLAGEWYFNGTGPDSAQNIFSATKSFASTLVGIAQGDGLLDIDDSASQWIEEWQGTPSEAVTVRNLLSNDSGREWSFDSDYNQLVRAPDQTAYAVGLGQSNPPGEVWVYNNAAIQTLERVLNQATGREVAQFAEERLFTPLGMTHTSMGTDRAGNTQMFMGIQSTCLDLARFGVMMLNHGAWGDRQIVSPAWVEAATGRPSTALNSDYGYLWWLNYEGVIANPYVATSLNDAENPATKVGQIAPGAPEEMYWAIGLGNQVIQIDPASRTVVVRLGKADLRPQPPTFGPVQASRVMTEAVMDGSRTP